MTDPNLLAEASNPATSAARLQELSSLDRGLWPALAANPSTYPALLDWLTQHGDDTVRAAVAARGAVPPAPPAAPPAPPAPAAPEPTVVLPAAAPLPAPPTPLPSAPAGLPGPPTASGTPATGGGSSSGRIALIIAAVVLVLAAIGGGAWALTSGDDDKDDTSANSSSTKDDDTADRDEGSDTNDRPADEDDKDDEPARGGGDAEDFCTALKEFGLDASMSANPGDADYDAIIDGYRDLADKAPSELKDELDLIVDFMESSASAQNPSDFQDFDFDEYFDAIEKMSTFAFENCV